MKRLFSFVFILGFVFQVYPQQFDTVYYSQDFDTFNLNYGYIDTLNSWFIGKPDKSTFDTAYSSTNAIFTDSLYYRINDSSSFINELSYANNCQGCLNFLHRFNTSEGFDGGYIEIAYDNDTNWVNVLKDPYVEYITTENFYDLNDTIKGGIPAFTGNSSGWDSTSICWTWFVAVKQQRIYWQNIYLKFTFQSDSIIDSLDGWMIDDIQIIGVSNLDVCFGSVKGENKLNTLINLYPNPATNQIVIDNKNDLDIARIELFDINGKLYKKEEWPYGTRKLKVPIVDINGGFILVKIIDADGNYGTHRVIITR